MALFARLPSVPRQASSERLADDFRDVRRQTLLRENAFELLARLRLAVRVVLAPTVEGAGDAGGDLRVHRVELQDHVGGELVAAAVCGVEVFRVGCTEGA